MRVRSVAQLYARNRIRFLTVGRRVRTRRGPFAGLEGVLKGKEKQSCAVVSLESWIQAVGAVDVTIGDVVPARWKAHRIIGNS